MANSAKSHSTILYYRRATVTVEQGDAQPYESATNKQATGMTKISRGGGYFRKFFGQGGGYFTGSFEF